MNPKKLSQKLKSIQVEWDKAEESLKLAEQVGGQVVFPAIKELRYAGRRIVDFILECTNGSDEEKIEDLLSDALFNCYRARHDAIDSAISTIAAEINISTKRLGYEPVLTAFPDLPQLMDELVAAQKLIAESRGVREDRDKLYTSIETVNLVNLVGLFSKFQANHEIMRGLAREQRMWKISAIVATIVGSIATIVFGVLSVFAA